MCSVYIGEVLHEDYLVPLSMNVNVCAKRLCMPASRINDIVLERRGTSADTALRLAHFFGCDALSWLNLQTLYDLRVAEIEKAATIAQEIKLLVA